MKRFLIYFFAAPFILFYAGLIIFFFINGVTGSENWVANLWKSSKAWWLILALLSGLTIWVIITIKIVGE